MSFYGMVVFNDEDPYDLCVEQHPICEDQVKI